MMKFLVTLWFYFQEDLKKKNLIVLGLFFAGTLGIAFAMNHFGGSYVDVAVVNESDVIMIDESMLNFDGVYVRFEAEAAARELLDAGEIDELFIISGDTVPVLEVVTYGYVEAVEVEFMLTHVLTMANIERLALANEIPLDVVAEIVEPIGVTVENMSEVDDADFIGATILATVVTWGLYMFALMSGQGMANQIVSEKMSRVMEVMLGKVHPTTTMLARIVAWLAGMLLWFVSIAAGVVVAARLGWIEVGSLFDALGEFVTPTQALFAFAVFLLGYLIYILLFVAAGAIATSVESLQKVLSPLMMAIVIPAMLPMFIDANTLLFTVLSYVPLFSPFLIIERFILGYATVIEVWIILALMVVFAVVVLNGAARIYMNGVSHTSEKLTLKDFKKLLAK